MRAAKMAEGVSICADRRLAMARSTFPHEVFWVRIAPTMTSKGVLAGHQRIGPRFSDMAVKYRMSEGPVFEPATSAVKTDRLSRRGLS
jgi:hypothetical protein